MSALKLPSTRELAILRSRSKHGDVDAKALVDTLANDSSLGKTAFISLGVPDSAGTLRSCVDFKDGHARLILGSAAGAHGNFAVRTLATNVPSPGPTLTTIGDSGAGVTISEVGGNLTVHFHSGVSTKNDIITAINGSTHFSASESIPGTDVWNAPDDEFSGINLSQDVGISVAAANDLDITPDEGLPLTGQPDVPRCMTVQFQNGWAGGKVTVIGQDQFGKSVTEVFDPDDGDTQIGTQPFSRIISARKELMAHTNTEDLSANGFVLLSQNNGLALTVTPADAVMVLFLGGVGQDPASVDLDKLVVTPQTGPDGSSTIKLLFNQ